MHVCMLGECGGQLKTGTQRISFFSFEVSSNALQRLRLCDGAEKEEGGGARSPCAPNTDCSPYPTSNFRILLMMNRCLSTDFAQCI